MSPNNIKSEFDSVGTGLAYGGPPNAAAIAETAMSEQDRAIMSSVSPPPGDPVKYNRDGQPAKRRGPKPDSKPAMTRRQEMNRHAQRYVGIYPALRSWGDESTDPYPGVGHIGSGKRHI